MTSSESAYSAFVRDEVAKLLTFWESELRSLVEIRCEHHGRDVPGPSFAVVLTSLAVLEAVLAIRPQPERGGPMPEPKEGATKTCPECGERATFSQRTRVPGGDAAFVGSGAAMPEPLPPVPAWSCKCGHFSALRTRDAS